MLLFRAPLHIPASFLSLLYLHLSVTRLHLCRPSVLYLELFLTISCCLLYAPPFSFYLHLAPVLLVASYLQFNIPLFLLQHMQPSMLSFCFFLSVCLGWCRLFSISAPLLQINDLICRNKQVSSTLGLIPFASCPEHVTDRAE